eukprot:5419643-Amphidinium_carterae.1
MFGLETQSVTNHQNSDNIKRTTKPKTGLNPHAGWMPHRPKRTRAGVSLLLPEITRDMPLLSAVVGEAAVSTLLKYWQGLWIELD